MKFLKIGLGLVGVLLLLLVIGGGIFIATFDANQYKSLISEQVKLQTGRDFSLQNIKPSIFPWLGVELQQVSLSNAAGFSAENMLKIQQLDVRLELLPLLSQNIRIDTIKVNGLELYLGKDKNGLFNWDDMLSQWANVASSNAASSKTASKNTIDNEQKTTSPLAGLVVNGVELTSANIFWDDASTGKKMALHDINLSTGRLRQGEALPIKISTHVALDEPAAKVALELKTKLEFDLNAQKYNLAELVLEINAQLQQPELKQLQLTFNTELNMDLAHQIFDMKTYTLKAKLQGDAFADNTLPISIAGSLAANLKKQTLKIKPLTVQTKELKINLEMMVNQLLDAPVVTGKLALETFNPRKLAASVVIDLPKTRSDEVLKNASLDLAFSATENTLNVSSLKLKLDKTSVSAKLNVNNFEKPEIVYSAKLDQLVLDDYLSPPVKMVASLKPSTKKSAASNAQVKSDIPIELPVAMLRKLNIKGVFEAASLVIADQQVSNLKIKSQAKAGVIKLSKLSASVLKGKVSVAARLDVRKQTPRYQINFEGKKLKAESIVNPILQDILGEKSVSMSGDTNISLNISTAGQSVNQLIAGSNGKFKLHMGQAKLHGVDAEYFVRKGVVNFLEEKKQPVPQAWRGQYQPKETTALKVASASAIIKQGVIINKDLLLKSSRFNITGAGKVYLAQEKLDYRVVVDVQPAKTKTAGERLLDVPMPVFVKGNFAQPDISIDSKVWLKSVGKELKAEVKAEIKQKLKKEKNKKIDKIKNKYKDKLKNLFR